ncbi:hypothetical protein TA3x_004493 [Tundrisphaera sp. TA3]|uniref:hypothetical protein n=1 Tax=Tundrisphaera sp. TA3 TaxID=3435775 RepID=UPI003EB80E1F
MRTAWTLTVAWFLAGMAAEAGDLRIGRAAVEISPAPGTPMLGAQRAPGGKLGSEEPLDPIRVKAVVMDQGGRRAALVVCDLTSIPLAMIVEARRLIGESTGIAPESVMISATHCHTVPQIRARLLGSLDEPTRGKALAYIAALPSRMAEAVRLAEADLRPASALAGLGHEPSVSFNRRFYLKDGTVKTNPFKDDDSKMDQVLRPTGPIDPGVGVVEFRAADGGRPLATLVNFAIHLDTVGGSRPSADFPAALDSTLRASLGAEMLTIFATGAAGNINHYDLLNPAGPRRLKGPEEAARIGGKLAAEVLRTRPQLTGVVDAPLGMARELVEIDYHPDKARRLREQIGSKPRHFDGEVEVRNEPGRTFFLAEVQAITLGDELAWVGFPGEMFAEFGLALKDASPFRYTMIHELANGSIGYVPNLRACPEGGYEAEATRCAPGSGERMVDAATRLLIRLKSQARPKSDRIQESPRP